MNGTRAHLKLKGTALVALVPLLAPVAAEASNAASTTQGGWGWWDAAIWVGALVGIVLFGFFGDLVVGAVIVGVAAVVSCGAGLVVGTGRHIRTRAQARTDRRRAGAVHALSITRGRGQPG
jgi:predicted lipid-binding transport protein (Tim44 family)